MKLRAWFGACLAVALGACGDSTPSVWAEIEPVAEVAAPPLPDNPHPAELATHCLLVLGSLEQGPHVELCKEARLWAMATERKGTVGAYCVLSRFTLEALVAARDAAIIPRSSAGVIPTILAVDGCNQSNQFVQLAPYPFTGDESADQKAFISFYLRAVGEDVKWSTLPSIKADVPKRRVRRLIMTRSTWRKA